MSTAKRVFAKLSAQEPNKVELQSNWKQFPMQAQRIFLDARQKASDKVSEAALDWASVQGKLYSLLQEAESSLNQVKSFEKEFSLTTNASAELEKTVAELKDYFDKANKYEAKFKEASKFKL